jgi:hypothetical protein
MKRAALIFDIILIILLFASCATSKEARNYRQSIDGNWQLKTVVSEGITGTIKSQLFNEADLACFVGSTWSFNKNNSLGSYTLATSGTQCAAVKRDLRWSIFEAENEPKLFQFKRLDNKLKEVDENSAGFRFTILQLNESTMQLRSDITFEGKPAAFIYNFVKI